MQVEQFRWRPQDGWRCTNGGSPADLVLYFGSPECIESAAAPAVLAERYPGALLFGCSTTGGILDREVDETGLVGISCRFRDTQLRLVEEDITDVSHSADVGRQLGEALRGQGLAGALILSDGVAVNGSALASSMQEALGGNLPVSGGLAGDGARFVRTLVGVGKTARPGRAAALGFYGRAIRLAHASAGGWDPFGPKRRITRAHGCVLEQLDGKPALALYERYLGDEAAGLPGTALLFPLMVWDPEAPSRTRVRTVLSIDRASGSMTFAGDVPEGWGAQLMRGSLDRLVDGAATAGQLAGASLAQSPDNHAMALLVSCIGRQLLLGQRVHDELDAVSASLGVGIPQIGFYSHGEITPDPDSGAAILQNQTMAITLLTEAA